MRAEHFRYGRLTATFLGFVGLASLPLWVEATSLRHALGFLAFVGLAQVWGLLIVRMDQVSVVAALLAFFIGPQLMHLYSVPATWEGIPSHIVRASNDAETLWWITLLIASGCILAASRSECSRAVVERLYVSGEQPHRLKIGWWCVVATVITGVLDRALELSPLFAFVGSTGADGLMIVGVIFSVMVGGVTTVFGPILGSALYLILLHFLPRHEAWYVVVPGVLASLVAVLMPCGLWPYALRLLRRSGDSGIDYMDAAMSNPMR